jgi:hypothetical protein
MRRIWTFVLGIVAGGVLIYAAMNYHLIRAKDGLHLVPKVNAQLASTYVDIRNFKVADWANHAEITAALLKAERRDLLEGGFTDSINNGLDRLLNRENR